MFLHADQLARMSTNQRKRMKALLSGTGEVMPASESEVEEVMNEQGLGWCSNCLVWHTTESSYGSFATPWSHCPRFRMVGRVVEIPNPIPEQPMPAWMAEQKSRLQADQEAAAVDAVSQIMNNPVLAQKLQEMMRGQQKAEAARQRQMEQEREKLPKKKVGQPRSWLKRTFNRCPDCNMDMLTNTWVPVDKEPEPLDEGDKVTYTKEPCGCQKIAVDIETPLWDSDIPF